MQRLTCRQQQQSGEQGWHQGSSLWTLPCTPEQPKVAQPADGCYPATLPLSATCAYAAALTGAQQHGQAGVAGKLSCYVAGIQRL